MSGKTKATLEGLIKTGTDLSYESVRLTFLIGTQQYMLVNSLSITPVSWLGGNITEALALYGAAVDREKESREQAFNKAMS